jgi:hypothetical protein
MDLSTGRHRVGTATLLAVVAVTFALVAAGCGRDRTADAGRSAVTTGTAAPTTSPSAASGAPTTIAVATTVAPPTTVSPTAVSPTAAGPGLDDLRAELQSADAALGAAATATQQADPAAARRQEGDAP